MIEYTGRHTARADAKGRLFLPSELRKRTEESGAPLSFVMRRDIYQPCLVLYPEEAWHEEVAALRTRLNRWNKREAMFFRAFVSDTEMLRLDSQGRFVVPKSYAEILSDDRRVVFLGVDDRIELWRSTEAEQMLSSALTDDIETMLSAC